jgi:F0F1-type ATP synthase epsilon subunit
MKFSVISPHALVHHAIVWLEITTVAGNMVIQENHAPMIAEIEPNSEVLLMQPNGKQIALIVVQGFIHIKRNDIKLIITQEA